MFVEQHAIKKIETSWRNLAYEWWQRSLKEIKASDTHLPETHKCIYANVTAFPVLGIPIPTLWKHPSLSEKPVREVDGQ